MYLTPLGPGYWSDVSHTLARATEAMSHTLYDNSSDLHWWCLSRSLVNEPLWIDSAVLLPQPTVQNTVQQEVTLGPRGVRISEKFR